MHTKNTTRPHDHDELDLVLRHELRWKAPPELTNQLLQLVHNPDLLGKELHTPSLHQTSAVVLPTQAKAGKWYSLLVMVLTCLAVGLSFAVTWQFYGVVGAELGLANVWLQLELAVANGLQWLYTELPATRTIASLLSTMYEQAYWLLNWLLVAAILWLILDKYVPENAQVAVSSQ
jgi:hypothetical protein